MTDSQKTEIRVEKQRTGVLSHRELTLLRRAAEDAIHAANPRYRPFIDAVANPLSILALVDMAMQSLDPNADSVLHTTRPSEHQFNSTRYSVEPKVHASALSDAQQVAVPMTEAQIFACDPVPHVMFDQQRIDFARAIEAFHGTTRSKAMTPTEEILLNEMRYIASISTGQVKRTAKNALAIVAAMNTPPATKPDLRPQNCGSNQSSF